MALVSLSDSQVLGTASFGGQGWRQAGELGLALLLSALIGLEREGRQKNAGLRTHTLVGLGAALFMLVSKYGFTDVLEPGRIVLDPSRMAAQIVRESGSSVPVSSSCAATRSAASPPLRPSGSPPQLAPPRVRACPSWLSRRQAPTRSSWR